MIIIMIVINVNDRKDSVNDNISSNQMITLESLKVIATLTIMIITATIITKNNNKNKSNSCNINTIDFAKSRHHLVLDSKSAPA